MFFLYCSGDHRELHVLTHSFPTRRSSDLVSTQPCPGLVEFVERGELEGTPLRALLSQYVAPLLADGADTLVLGCTHYPFLRPVLSELVGPPVRLLDTGEAVARQPQRVLDGADLPAPTENNCTLEMGTKADTPKA